MPLPVLASPLTRALKSAWHTVKKNGRSVSEITPNCPWQYDLTARPWLNQGDPGKPMSCSYKQGSSNSQMYFWLTSLTSYSCSKSSHTVPYELRPFHLSIRNMITLIVLAYCFILICSKVVVGDRMPFYLLKQHFYYL